MKPRAIPSPAPDRADQIHTGFTCREDLDLVARVIVEKRRLARREAEAEIVGFGESRKRRLRVVKAEGV